MYKISSTKYVNKVSFENNKTQRDIAFFYGNMMTRNKAYIECMMFAAKFHVNIALNLLLLFFFANLLS